MYVWVELLQNILVAVAFASYIIMQSDDMPNLMLSNGSSISFQKELTCV